MRLVFDTDGFMDWDEFEVLTRRALQDEGFTDDDLNNMSIFDTMERIGELIEMDLEDDDERGLIRVKNHAKRHDLFRKFDEQ